MVLAESKKVLEQSQTSCRKLPEFTNGFCLVLSFHNSALSAECECMPGYKFDNETITKLALRCEKVDSNSENNLHVWRPIGIYYTSTSPRKYTAIQGEMPIPKCDQLSDDEEPNVLSAIHAHKNTPVC